MRVEQQTSVALILLIIVATVCIQLPSASTDAPVCYLLPSKIPPLPNSLTESDVSLTWTSRWSTTPQSVVNETEIVGDHVVINATFAEDLNVTQTQMSLLDGFRVSTNRKLLNYSISNFPSIIGDYCDLIQINGLKQGMPINITCDFTNGDSDFFAWSSDLPTYERTYENNILGSAMCTENRPERASFILASECGSMVFGAYNYDETPGNWTLDFIAGNLHEVSVDGNSATLDTYSLEHNATVEISLIGNTSTNDAVFYNWYNVTFCNYFMPEVHIVSVLDIGNSLYNITWISSDLNEDDVNYYSVFISRDSHSYMLLVMNLAETHFVWDSSGFLRETYYVKIRAYSLDFTYGNLCSLENPPHGYWPGDFSDSEPIEFLAGDVTTGPSPGWYQLNLDHPADITYLEFSTGNTIVWTPTIEGWLIYYVDYNVNLNGSVWTSGRYYPRSNNSIVINIDGLAVGLYDFEIMFGSISDRVLVRVIESQVGMLVHYGAIGVSIGSSIVILIVVVLTLRLRREYYAQVSNP